MDSWRDFAESNPYRTVGEWMKAIDGFSWRIFCQKNKLALRIRFTKPNGKKCEKWLKLWPLDLPQEKAAKIVAAQQDNLAADLRDCGSAGSAARMLALQSYYEQRRKPLEQCEGNEKFDFIDGAESPFTLTDEQITERLVSWFISLNLSLDGTDRRFNLWKF